MNSKTAESILGLSGDYSLEDAKRAYRKAAKENHPDLNQDAAGQEEKMTAINAAYEYIRDNFDSIVEERNKEKEDRERLERERLRREERARERASAESARQRELKEQKYCEACLYESAGDLDNLERAIDIFESLGSWNDCPVRTKECKAKREHLIRDAAKRRDKKRFRRIVVLAVIAVLVLGWNSPFVQGRLSDKNDFLDGITVPVANTAKSGIDSSKLRVGDKVEFGTYAQKDYDTHFDYSENKLVTDYSSYTLTEYPLVWRVLAIRDGSALLLSEYVYENKSYTNDADWTDHPDCVSWPNSNVGAYLNDEFLVESFTEDERSCILDTQIPDGTADDLQVFLNGYSSPSFYDKIFILSSEEVKKYLGEDRVANEVKHYSSFDSTYSQSWWVRADKVYSHKADKEAGIKAEAGISVVEHSGQYDLVDPTNGTYYYVRPAMWVKL